MNKISRSIIFILLITSFAFQGCINDKSRKNHKWTFKVCDSLYTEIFSTFGQGAWGGDRDGQWLTDSTSFRIFLGAFDEVNGKIFIECKKDSVFVTQFPDDLDVNKKLKSPVTKAYQIEDLKKMDNLYDF
ncbi:MAG: hypothetical protein J0L56_15675 [Chitinophagales bacterium]|nr:hypothetical protein [Chitinophagales bacterium]